MGAKHSVLFTPPKDPGSLCSEDGCFKECITWDGHRKRRPHKSRCCSVCSKWYCGNHKIKNLSYTDVYPEQVCSDHDIHQLVYKCRFGTCLNMYGLHQLVYKCRFGTCLNMY
eukprot:66356_1